MGRCRNYLVLKHRAYSQPFMVILPASLGRRFLGVFAQVWKLRLLAAYGGCRIDGAELDDFLGNRGAHQKPGIVSARCWGLKLGNALNTTRTFLKE